MGCLGLPLLVGVAPALRSVLVRTWRTTTEKEINCLLSKINRDRHPDKMRKTILVAATHCGGPGAPGGPGLYGLGL